MEISVTHDDGDLVLRCDDIEETIVEGVFVIAPTDDFVNAAARLFQKLLNKRDGTTATEPSDKAHSYAGRIAREFAKRISQIYDEAVVESVIEEEMRELIAEEFGVCPPGCAQKE
jgi:hypothetical protein